MSKKIHLILACGDYEIIRALKERTVEPDGIELTILTDMTADVRHGRMIRNREFDVAELSMSNYLIAKHLGLPFVRYFCIAASAMVSFLSTPPEGLPSRRI
jgi:4,5-dihydroxyphthalate decarboxylase